MSADLVFTLILTTAFLLLSVSLTLIVGGGRLTDTKLIVLGILVAIAAVLYGAAPTTIRVGGESETVATSVPFSQTSGILMRIAFLLVLAGVIAFFESRGIKPAYAPGAKDPLHG